MATKIIKVKPQKEDLKPMSASESSAMVDKFIRGDMPGIWQKDKPKLGKRKRFVLWLAKILRV